MSQPSTQSLQDMIANLDIESAQLAKSNTAVGQAGATWLSRVARELKALLPSLESALEERQVQSCDVEKCEGEKPALAATEGASAREVAEQIVKPYMSAGAFAIDCATQLIELHTSQAVAQARVDEARQWDERICTQNYEWRQKRIAGLERDLAAIAKETMNG